MFVVSYLAGVPSPAKNPHKTEVLKKFTIGVSRTGDKGLAHSGKDLISCDVGIIQGWVHENSPNTPHLLLRKQVSSNKKNKRTIIVDSNLFNYNIGKIHPLHYSRYSMDGVFPTTGNYFWDNPNPSRWNQICKDLNISVKDWRQNGNHILLACQRNGGWSMQGYNVVSWIKNTVMEIRKYSDRPILVRGHPGDKYATNYLSNLNIGVKISTNEKIIDDFRNCWAAVTYNSSPGVAAGIEGVPVFVTDPNPKISQAFDIANTDLSLIENPKTFDRINWLNKLSMCHWKADEILSGEAWIHMREYI